MDHVHNIFLSPYPERGPQGYKGVLPPASLLPVTLLQGLPHGKVGSCPGSGHRGCCQETQDYRKQRSSWLHTGSFNSCFFPQLGLAYLLAVRHSTSCKMIENQTDWIPLSWSWRSGTNTNSNTNFLSIVGPVLSLKTVFHTYAIPIMMLMLLFECSAAKEPQEWLTWHCFQGLAYCPFARTGHQSLLTLYKWDSTPTWGQGEAKLKDEEREGLGTQPECEPRSGRGWDVPFDSGRQSQPGAPISAGWQEDGGVISHNLWVTNTLSSGSPEEYKFLVAMFILCRNFANTNWKLLV